MKFSIQIDEKCEQALHNSTCGDAFALDSKSKFAIFGGEYNSTIVDLNDPTDIVKQIPIKTPLKWFVTNYEWDPFGANGNERFMQTRNKIIEIINTETSDILLTLNSHSQPINEAKWSPLKKKIFASSSNDNNILLWSLDSNKPTSSINSIGEVDCLVWSKCKENLFACSCNNDIRTYDIRKTNAAVRYIPNAHTKKIYSLDWCSGPEEILLSSSRDRNIKLWHFNMLNQKFMEKILEDFPCWKAKFTPFGLCFAVIPTSQSVYNPYQFKNQNMSPKSFSRQLNESVINNGDKINEDFEAFNNDNDKNIISNSGNNNSFKQCSLNNKNDPVTSLLVCQITSFDEARVFKFVTNKFDTILDFDFYTQNDRFNIVSWTNDQYLCIQSIDSSQLITKDLERSSSAHNNIKSKEEDDSSSNINISIKQGLSSNNNQIQPNTSNSSRKSSISEFGYGTPPTNITGRSILDRESFNLNDENSDFNKITSNSLSITHSHTLLRSSSALLVSHEFLKRHPKCFGAKFSGLPDQFLIFSNEGQFKLNQRDQIELAGNKRYRNPNKIKSSSSSNTKTHIQHNKQLAKRVQAKVYIYDIQGLINICKGFAENYMINDSNLKKLCDQNIMTSIQLKRYDIAKIWELLKFITFNNIENFSLNPDHGRPWSCSTFGRPLINNIIDNCVKSNDIQTAVMIISKLKQHDMNMVPIASTVIRKPNYKLGITNNSILSHNFSLTSICTKEELALSSNKLSKVEENNAGDSDLTKHHRNLGLLEPSRVNEFDFLIKFYCDILYRWNLFNKRIEMFEYVYEKPYDYDDKFECSKRCVKCSNLTNNSKCNYPKCNSYLTYCSICELPVNGLTTYCVICGHGGHYDHFIEWFKRHDDCPSACGCRCIDYL